MNRALDVLAVGDGNLDVWMRVPRHPDRHRGGVRGSGVVGEACQVGPGGAAANVAMGMARLGASAAFVGAIGDDAPGSQFVKGMRAVGVDTSHLHVMERRATSLACMFETPDGEYAFYVCPGSRTIPSHCLAGDFVRSARILYVTGHVLTEDESTCAVILDAMATARDAGVTVALDPGKYWLNPALESRVHEAVKYTDIILPNQEEAEQLTGRHAPRDAAADLLEAGVGIVSVTLGGRGCLVATEDRMVEQPAFRVRTGSTVGAGDAFASGLLYSFLLKENLEEMAAFANAAAAIKIGTPGASEGLPGSDEVRAFLRENA
ncbi:MAG: carbohydrate kinase family protein [Gemmatimonadetes bacterium]|nr:carbohydrate kinase family protein [Gemmatimonadota bacterium]MYG84594.1 carbohydrate kinase family protein [Gemmatimonadota bacterium]MYJ90565.1 carbohydrate kinase family protein [Gemmatimonadota bacterium]